ncbi:hypothetical protein [Cupriavidus consociatus]|uniref:hypothetical protein n=1 Tax=Cupriavidus consociatus TaxID=2821357 RepID=UPI001AE504AF|nr:MULTISPECIES: hypothetical protein [unclassified Cupriavidus]MBP0622120.1 hypothetical protein [Cupriavidus sp. LEh25]MDK2658797.1 hypothetical protein [Cupriavidus sp. LEh21]
MTKRLLSAMRQYAWFSGVKHHVVQGVEALAELLKSPSAAARAVAAVIAETEHGVQVWVSYLGKPLDPHTNYVLWPNRVLRPARRRIQPSPIEQLQMRRRRDD